jgi:hypothetical protein
MSCCWCETNDDVCGLPILPVSLTHTTATIFKYRYDPTNFNYRSNKPKSGTNTVVVSTSLIESLVISNSDERHDPESEATGETAAITTGCRTLASGVSHMP